MYIFFMAGLRSKYQLICFASRYLIFFFFLLFWTVGPTALANGNKRAQNFNVSSIRYAGGEEYKSIFSPTFCFLFHLFQVEYSNNSRIIYGFRSSYSSSIKCVTLKTEKTLNISDINQPIFIKLHQNERTVSGHIILATAHLENVGQGQDLKKC